MCICEWCISEIVCVSMFVCGAFLFGVCVVCLSLCVFVCCECGD